MSLLVDLVEEELAVCDHPEAVEEEHEWGHAKHADSIFSQLVVHGRWQFVEIRKIELFKGPNIEVGESSNREEDWHTGPIEARDESDVEEL